LAEAELERIREALVTPARPRLLLKVAARSPWVVPEIGRAILTAVKQALYADAGVIWLLQSERVRLVVSDAATGVAWHDEEPFLPLLRPYLSPDVRALEIGCGGGRVSRHVAPEVRELVVSDVSQAMLREAEANLTMFPNVRFVRTDGLVLDKFGEDEFDVVFAHGVLGHLDPFPLLSLIAASHRVLRSGGHFVANVLTIDDANGRHAALDVALRSSHHGLCAADRPYTGNQVKALFEVAGFEGVSLNRADCGCVVAIGTRGFA
jgi:SAM-dependent methyltransferase